MLPKKHKTPLKNKNLTCQQCGKWFKDDDLMITPKGAFCEDCYQDYE